MANEELPRLPIPQLSLKLFPDNLHQHSFPAAPVKLPVEDLLPGAEIQLAVGHGHHHFPAHDLALHVGVGIVLPDIVAVLGHRRVGRELLQPDIVVVVQARLVIVDEDAGGDVHGVSPATAPLDAALLQALLHFPGDVDEGAGRPRLLN